MSAFESRSPRLLEALLLILIVVMVFVIVAVWVPIAERGLRVNRAINSIHVLVESGYHWAQTTPDQQVKVNTPLIPILVRDHYLSLSYASPHGSPWHEAMAMAFVQDAQKRQGLHIEFSHVPAEDCQLLLKRVADWARRARCEVSADAWQRFSGDF